MDSKKQISLHQLVKIVENVQEDVRWVVESLTRYIDKDEVHAMLAEKVNNTELDYVLGALKQKVDKQDLEKLRLDIKADLNLLAKELNDKPSRAELDALRVEMIAGFQAIMVIINDLKVIVERLQISVERLQLDHHHHENLS